MPPDKYVMRDLRPLNYVKLRPLSLRWNERFREKLDKGCGYGFESLIAST